MGVRPSRAMNAHAIERLGLNYGRILYKSTAMQMTSFRALHRTTSTVF